MSRIRSIHPGIFTDEAFVSVSMAARVLLPGLWTEADDHGVFEWKPIALKMKIFPADNVDVEALLGELVDADIIQGFSCDGKNYGVVRNFCKYQRPKKPTYKHVLPDELRTYVGLSEESTVPVENQSPTGGGKSPQMEDEGEGRRKKERKEEDTAKAVSTYFFESGIIRLTEKDFKNWEAAFTNLELRAELIGLTEWAGSQAKWFHAVSGALAKRNREIKIRKTSPPPPKVLSPFGTEYPDGIV